MRFLPLASALLLGLFFSALPAGAEIVVLKSGAALSGSLAGQSAESVDLVTASGTARITRSAIERIEKDSFRVTTLGGLIYEGTIEDMSASHLVLLAAGRRISLPRADIAKAEPLPAVSTVPLGTEVVFIQQDGSAAPAEQPGTAAVTATPPAQPAAPVQVPAQTALPPAQPAEQAPYAEITPDGRVKRGFLGRGATGMLELSAGAWFNDLRLDLTRYGGGLAEVPGKTGLSIGAAYLFRFKSGFALGAGLDIQSLGTKTHTFSASSVKTSGGITALEALADYEFKTAKTVRPYLRAGLGIAMISVKYSVSDAATLNEGHKTESTPLLLSAAIGARVKLSGANLAAELRCQSATPGGELSASGAGAVIPAVKIFWLFN